MIFFGEYFYLKVQFIYIRCVVPFSLMLILALFPFVYLLKIQPFLKLPKQTKNTTLSLVNIHVNK